METVENTSLGESKFMSIVFVVLLIAVPVANIGFSKIFENTSI